MSESILFTSFELGDLTLRNRVVMAPMTRSRAEGNVPNARMARYYAERAGAGLIVTEGTAPSPDGLGYARIPGVYSAAQIDGWRGVTDAVHAAGGRIFVQLMHTGRVGHPLNMEPGAELLAPSALAAPGEMYTDAQGPQPYPAPRAMTIADIERTVAGYARAAQNAIAAGFDGVELHGANGYLIDQFLNPVSNVREDAYGGSVENRVRFALEVARATVDAIGAARVGLRASPYGAFNGMTPFEGTHETHVALAEGLGRLGLVYLHLVDHASMGAPAVDPATKAAIRKAFGGTIVLSGGYDRARAEADLIEGKGELVAFGRPALANPDLVRRLREGAPLNAVDFARLYTPGDAGYNDYPALS